ncbi:hypothetical protein ACFWU3_32860 [Streptomyces sp. NPDC058685]|uniref:hypothetical protein n=1 Tax=Streptomyces sp. NPDC058685 TaxID=3346598 RepID=UPI00365A045A
MLSRFSNGVDLPQQMQSAVADIAESLTLPGTMGGAVGHLTTALVGALRERRPSVRALAGCTRLADFLKAEPDLETLSFATYLLAGDRTHRDFGRLLQRIMWLMPGSILCDHQA